MGASACRPSTWRKRRGRRVFEYSCSGMDAPSSTDLLSACCCSLSSLVQRCHGLHLRMIQQAFRHCQPCAAHPQTALLAQRLRRPKSRHAEQALDATLTDKAGRQSRRSRSAVALIVFTRHDSCVTHHTIILLICVYRSSHAKQSRPCLSSPHGAWCSLARTPCLLHRRRPASKAASARAALSLTNGDACLVPKCTSRLFVPSPLLRLGYSSPRYCARESRHWLSAIAMMS